MSAQNNKSSHVLITLGVLFTIASAARLIPESQAAAEEAKDNTASTAEMDEDALGAPQEVEKASKPKSLLPAPAESKTTPMDGEICFSGETAAALSEDRWLFEQREAALVEQQLALQEWESRLQNRTSELEALETLLNERWAQMKTESNSDLKHLAQMYGSMKPDQASLIFNEMDTNFAAGFLRQLPSDQAGLILANMDTEKAYVVSVRLASMNDDIRQTAD